jgi:hypothetical protein
MADELNNSEYESWFSHLFPSHGYRPLVLVSAAVTLGIFVLCSGIVMLDPSYSLSWPTVYLSMVGIFGALVWLGWVDGVYVDVWSEVRPVFAVDDETYRAVVHPGLERIYDERRVLAYWVAVTVPSLLVASVLFLPGLPTGLQEPVRTLFVSGTGLSPSLTQTVLVYLFAPIELLLLVTAFHVLSNHVTLVREASELPFRDLHTSALGLEPMVGFGMASATAWLGGASVVALWARIVGYDPLLEQGTVLLLALVGVVAFFAPFLVLHLELRHAKRRKLAEIRNEYDETRELMERDPEPSENLSFRLEVTDRRLESAKSIHTWPYNAASVWRLVTASVIPVLTLVDGVRQFIDSGGVG